MLLKIKSEPQKSSTHALKADFIRICFVSQELISKFNLVNGFIFRTDKVLQLRFFTQDVP